MCIYRTFRVFSELYRKQNMSRLKREARARIEECGNRNYRIKNNMKRTSEDNGIVNMIGMTKFKKKNSRILIWTRIKESSIILKDPGSSDH